jgi:hypothetical protein
MLGREVQARLAVSNEWNRDGPSTSGLVNGQKQFPKGTDRFREVHESLVGLNVCMREHEYVRPLRSGIDADGGS